MTTEQPDSQPNTAVTTMTTSTTDKETEALVQPQDPEKKQMEVDEREEKCSRFAHANSTSPPLEDEDDEEEALLVGMEEADEEKKEDDEAAVAPTLLREAISNGTVPDSPKKIPGINGAPVSSEKDKARDTRMQQLDFLLSRATEYSNFIAQDLAELQESMAAQASAAEEKKRKKGGPGRPSKKSKANDGTAKSSVELMAEAQINAAEKKSVAFIQPRNLAAGCQLKDYQLEGVRWLASLYENGVSGILADDMGLGKTIQVIALIAHLRTMDVSGPYIVVAPLATLPNWVREFQKWLPEQPVVRFHGTEDERKALLNGPLNPRNKKESYFPVIVTNYETAIRTQRKLDKFDFTFMIVDEGQRLKNHRCTLIKSLKDIPSANRLLLSGTPIQNNLDELWSLLNFVNPQIFDDLSVFQSWFGFRNIGQDTKEDDILAEQQRNQTVTKLHEILRPFLLRRVKSECLKDLPPKKEVIVYCGMSKLQLGYMQAIEDKTLSNTLIAQGIPEAKGISQHAHMNQRKNTNHPFLFGEPIDPATGLHIGTAHPQLLVKASGKFALLDRMLTRLFDNGHQVLIFSQMTKVLNIMEDYLAYRKWNYCRIDGSTAIDDRQKYMDEFNKEKTSGVDGQRNKADDRMFVFLLSTRAGGLGINLASADTCIIFDSDWNPHQDSQAMDRCYRIGQTEKVAVYRLLTVNSVDIDMMERAISKKKLERMAIAGGDFRKAGVRSRGELNVSDLNKLLESDIKDLSAKGTDVEHIKIDDDEFELIMDREKLFAPETPTDGRMYDLIEGDKGDMLSTMAG